MGHWIIETRDDHSNIHRSRHFTLGSYTNERSTLLNNHVEHWLYWRDSEGHTKEIGHIGADGTVIR